MKISKRTQNILQLFIISMFALVIIVACDKAKETAEDAAEKVAEKTEEVVSQAAEEIGETAKEAVKKVTDEVKNNFLVGTWSGKFDGRKTVLTITNQDGNDFNGKITINYRDVIKQEVKGVLDPLTNTITMQDQLHSRYSGSYKGKLSNDNIVYSGVFTMKVDGKKFNFNLKKK